MTTGADEKGLLRRDRQARIVAHSEVPEDAGLVVEVRVLLDGSYPPAQRAFGKAVQTYADKLSQESAYQETSSRVAGALTAEITESAVIRAQESLDRKTAAAQRPATKMDAVALIGLPIFSGAVGVVGSYLDNAINWTALIVLALAGIYCILHLFFRRLL